MSFPLTYKKRKKNRHKKHKIEADKYNTYLNSEQFEIDLQKSIKEFLSKNK